MGWVGVFSDVSNLRRLERVNLEVERVRAEEAERNRVLHERFLDSELCILYLTSTDC